MVIACALQRNGIKTMITMTFLRPSLNYTPVYFTKIPLRDKHNIKICGLSSGAGLASLWHGVCPDTGEPHSCADIHMYRFYGHATWKCAIWIN